MSHWRDLLMLNTLRVPVGNMQIFIRIQIRILHVVQSADPHCTRNRICALRSLAVQWIGINRTLFMMYTVYPAAIIGGDFTYISKVDDSVTFDMNIALLASQHRPKFWQCTINGEWGYTHVPSFIKLEENVDKNYLPTYGCKGGHFEPF